MLNPVVLPIENKLEDYSTILIDSPGNITDEDPNVSNQVKSASAVIILYDMTDETSATTIRDFWLPFVKKFNPKVAAREQVPVIIVGNKLDLVKVSSNTSYFTRIGKILRPLMRSFEVSRADAASADGHRGVGQGEQEHPRDALPCAEQLHLPARPADPPGRAHADRQV